MSNPFNLIMLSAMHEMGGNTTQRFFDGHPQLMTYPFESTLATSLSSNLIAGPQHWMPQRYAYPVFDAEWSAEQCYHAMADHELKPYLRARATSKFASCGLEMNEKARLARFLRLANWPNGDPKRVIRAQQPSRAGYIEAHFRATFDTWTNFARTGKETTYVGYIPPILMDADRFFSDFPNGHMLHVIRNPWSGYANTLSRPYPFPLERYCQMWNTCQTQAAVYQRKYAGRFHVIHCEDLFANPKETLNHVLAKIGLDLFTEQPRPSFNRKPLEHIKPWGAIDQATPEANLEAIASLTKEQRDQIAIECAPLLGLWGYGSFLDP